MDILYGFRSRRKLTEVRHIEYGKKAGLPTEKKLRILLLVLYVALFRKFRNKTVELSMNKSYTRTREVIM